MNTTEGCIEGRSFSSTFYILKYLHINECISPTVETECIKNAVYDSVSDVDI